MSESDKDIGAIWIKTSKAGKEWLGIKLTIEGKDYNLVAFQNAHKQGIEARPDYRIFPIQPKGDRAVGMQMIQPEPKGTTLTDEDVPF
jgi:hypothetical protein